ncbi:hypothetical protein [Pinirhizobacter soli]|uniref:hypothetical protein n=1 Tax=Pinirhizobacter soli TaxID=2786953 RepID=UPI002029C82D|nr:hypothetical protein [Pinirhizobacter soli]
MRIWKRVGQTAIVGAIGALTVSCAALTSTKIEDLTVRSIKTVNLRDVPQVEWMGKGPRPSLEISRIDLATSVDLWETARRHEYNVAFTVSPCVGKDSPPGAVGYYDGVFWEKQRITSFQLPTPDYVAALKDGTVTYQVYIGIPAQAAPGTFCLQLSGGTMGGATISSNTVPLNP